MNIPPRAAAFAATALAALLMAGCAARPASTSGDSVQNCTDYTIHAVEHHLTPKRLPAACRGLSGSQVKLAIGRAIYVVAGAGQRKVAWRRRAATAGEHLGYLITHLPPEPVSPRLRPAAPPGRAPARHPGGVPALGAAALGTWLTTAGIGSYLLGGWIAHGGIRRRGSSGRGVPPTVMFGHLSLAAAGLVAWIVFLITGSTPVAWGAVGSLLITAGFGMAMVSAGLADERGPASAARVRPAQAGGRPPVAVIAAHGLLAVSTMLLALLTALGTG
ncbi:MAG TPA: hypothetical protein VMV92_21155 [Streptosporangiaceae bacterium]|nr:hypothetical protein [Streptosporangiaceae bacterium]